MDLIIWEYETELHWSLIIITSASAPYSCVLVFEDILFQDTAEGTSRKEDHQRAWNTIFSTSSKK